MEKHHKTRESVFNALASSRRSVDRRSAEKTSRVIHDSEVLIQSAEKDIIVAESHLRIAADKLRKAEYAVSSDYIAKSMGLISNFRNHRSSINCMSLSANVRKMFNIHAKFHLSLRSALDLVSVNQHDQKEDRISNKNVNFNAGRKG